MQPTFVARQNMEGETPDGLSLKIPLLLHNTNAEDLQWHRKAGEASFFKTCFNTINALSGIGILSVPYALSSGGWASLILLFTIAAATCFTALLMHRCMVLDSNIKTYPDIGERAFGRLGRATISIFMYLELYLVATGFLIMEGDNLSNMFPSMGLDVGGIRINGRAAFVIVVALVILPTLFLDNLSSLSYVSAGGVIASVVILSSIAWEGTVDGVGFNEKGTLLNLNRIPTAISLYAFCYCAHPVFPTLYSSMKDQRQFPRVMFLCFTLCTISYAAIAVLGYLMYGESLQSQVTLNLPPEKFVSKIAIYTTLVIPIAKYALMTAPIVTAIENQFPHWNKNRFTSLLIRTSILISTVIVALAVPFFGDLMSLVGAFLSTTASITLPCVCYLKISETHRKWGLVFVLTALIILLGISAAVMGTYTSLKELLGHW